MKMRLLLTSVLFFLPLSSLAALEAGAPGAEPTTTLFSTSTMTSTKTLAHATVTSTLAPGESTPPPEIISSTTSSSSSSSSSSAEAVSSSAPAVSSPLASSPVVSSPVVSSSVPLTSSAPQAYATPVPSFTTSASVAPYPIPGSTGAALPSGSGTVAPTGTGVSPVPPKITPFTGAASKLGGHTMLFALVAMAVASLAVC